MEETLSERIKRLFIENKISDAGLNKAHESGLINDEDYHSLVDGDYERLSAFRPEDKEEENTDE